MNKLEASSEDPQQHEQEEHQRMERERAQAAKMEALGRLTSGIAHDFNNLLAIILGYTELARRQLEKDTDHAEIPDYLDNVLEAGNRAKDLTKQLLIFGKKRSSECIAQPLKPLLKECIELIGPSFPDSIKLTTQLADGTADVAIGVSQCYQLLMNLLINAKDAMDGSGLLEVILESVEVVSQECSHCHQLVVGHWVSIRVKDTGKGMDEKIKARIFDPFFTTKEGGKGTGMGLAVVQGIVTESQGHIMLKSDPDEGTSIQILLPPAADKVAEKSGI